jgi:glycosyltransferase involved in cell wall biosynthesis
MLNACTILACNALPYARVLADSFLAHHSGGSFTALLIDDRQGRHPERFDLRRPGDLGLQEAEIHRLAGIYDEEELGAALKPLLLRRLLDEGKDHVVYLAPRVRIYDSIAELEALVRQHGIVLTPRTTRPYPDDDRQVDRFTALAEGVYDTGFLAVAAGADAFLDWWWRRTRREALADPAKLMFRDSRWIDCVPSFFDHYILKDPGYSVSYRNLHGREVTRADRYLVDGAPLRSFDFTGFDISEPYLLSKEQGERPRVLLSEHPAIANLCQEYAAGVAASDASDLQLRYGWSHLPGGLPISSRIRRVYRAGLLAAERGEAPAPPDPFDPTNPPAFIEWLNSRSDNGPPRVSRYLHSLYEDRVDLQFHFPNLQGDDAIRFADWARGEGAIQNAIPEELRPTIRMASASVEPSAESMSPAEGVKVTGFFRAELGIGEAARLLTAALDAARIPYSTNLYGATVSRQAHSFDARGGVMQEYDVNLLCVNADTTARLARSVAPSFFAGRHTIGYWFWEVEDFPPSMYPGFDVVDEVWAATDFVADAIRRANRKPVFKVPLPVPVPQISAAITREALGLRSGFLFVMTYDFFSVLERKNPVGVIRAFTRAFKDGEGPILMLKSINGHLRLNDLERVRAAAADRSDVLVVDSYYSAEERDALFGLCDCVVSLHRSEGLGLTLAEAMTLGKPVIATGYSGNLHFMTPENSFLVDYTEAKVPPGCAPYPAGAKWAEPDLDRAAQLMRDVFERPAEAKQRARRGQRDVLERHSVDASGKAVASRLSQIRESRRRVASTEPGNPPSPSFAHSERQNQMSPPVEQRSPHPAPAVASLEQMLARLEQSTTPAVSAPSVQPLAGLRTSAQRVLFRLLKPYWFQQHQVQMQLVSVLRHLVAGFGQQQTNMGDIATELSRLREAIAALEGRLQEIRQTIRPDAQIRDLQSRGAALAGELEGLRRRIVGPENQLKDLQSDVAALVSELERMRSRHDRI